MKTILSDPARMTKGQREQGEAFAPLFDDRGLILAIATQNGTNEVLMVAYMNREAIEKTLHSGTVHYYSRSRQSLWKKGETSGETQKLIEMRTDCDQDVLLLRVEQTGRGAACHTGRKSCFYRKVEMKDGQARLTTDGEAPLFDPSHVYGSQTR